MSEEKNRLERSIAALGAEERCATRLARLNIALQAVTENVGDQGKLDALKREVRESLIWGNIGNNNLAKSRDVLTRTAEEIKKRFGFTE